MVFQGDGSSRGIDVPGGLVFWGIGVKGDRSS